MKFFFLRFTTDHIKIAIQLYKPKLDILKPIAIRWHINLLAFHETLVNKACYYSNLTSKFIFAIYFIRITALVFGI